MDQRIDDPLVAGHAAGCRCSTCESIRATRRTGQSPMVPTDDELKAALMKTADLHHQLLTVAMTVLRIILVVGGMIVAIRIADSLTT